MMRFPIAFLTLALVTVPSVPTSQRAADGDLDPTFGVGGRVRYEGASGYPLSASASAIQSDGKIIAVGSIGVTPDGTDFVLARFNPDGSLDITFGSGGKVTTDFGPRDEAAAIAIQPDGKIIASGRTFTNSTSDFALARYNPDGSLDVTFGVGGKVTADFYGRPETADDLAIQSDGKIVVAAGRVLVLGLSSDFELVRFNPNGSLDTTFGIDGKVTTDFVEHDEARAIAIQSDGKIVAAGILRVPPYNTPYSFWHSGRGAVVRYNGDGSLDTTFGTGGKVIAEILDTSEFNALSIQSDGKIIAAGLSRFAFSTAFGLVRYNSDGSLDTSFGAQGRVKTDLLNNAVDVICALSLQPDGKIIAAGQSDIGGWDPWPWFGLARYNRDGSLDTTFGAGGTFRMDLPYDQVAYARSVGIQPDGKIVVAGEGQTFDHEVVYTGTPQSTFVELARFNNPGLQIVSAIHFDPANIDPGGFLNVRLSGSNLTDQTYFDVRFRSPRSTTDQVGLNWQQGTSARHSVPADTPEGTWIVTGVRAHDSIDDHSGEFMPVYARLDVSRVAAKQ